MKKWALIPFRKLSRGAFATEPYALTLAMAFAWLILVPGIGSTMVFDEAAVMDLPLLTVTHVRRIAIPIAIALRSHFAGSYYRDSFVRMLKAWDVDCVYIASGFFTDFIARMENAAPDFGIDEEMAGKKVFLLGGYDENPATLCKLRNALIRRGVEAHAYRLTPPERGETPLRWHAKVAVFLSDTKPVLAIVGR